jgi:hypothetical protein
MSEAQRYVMVTKFLIPMVRNNFRSTMAIADVEEDGKPKMFDELAARQVEKMGGQPVKMKTYNESVEDQISRIERLLENTTPIVEQEVDVRLYKMDVDAKISADRAAKTKQLQDQLRGIKNVTTVTTKDAVETLAGEKVRLSIKFTLVGQQSRTDFVAKQLIPAMNAIQGVEVINKPGVGWSAPIEVTPGKKLSEIDTLQEYGFGGGVASNLGAQRYTSGTEMPTPRPQLQTALEDWAEGGVMAYDVPTNTTDMRYHVMLPVEELLPFMGREYRGDMRDFKGRYQHFIRDGATAPVYVALGKNGRIKITGNEDLVWFAKKSGLAELPVFLSYQKQV